MKVNVAREETITNMGQGKKFSIEASAKAFQILSSNLYERKEEAIIRELGCNAYDSHVQAGKPEAKFYVHLPTMLEPYLIVQDFGLGLDQEQVETVYTTYFRSTKTDTNDLIGGLGLGSKTPFSYTDSFLVTARKDGMERVFNCSIGETGEPEVKLMYAVETDEQNGVAVRVEVNERDIRTFVKCAEKVYQWFKVRPNTNKEINYEITPDILESIERDGYYLKLTQAGYNRATKVIMGQVAYAFDLSSLQNETMDNSDVVFMKQIMHNNVHLYLGVGIGEVDINAGRENLSLDDETKANLISKIQKIRKNFSKTVEAKILQCSNIVEAYNKCSDMERSAANDIKVNGYCFNDILRSRIALDKTKHPTLLGLDCTFYGPKRGYGEPRTSRVSEVTLHRFLNPNLIDVVVNDCELKTGLKSAVKDNNKLSNTVFVISDKLTKVTPELKKELDNLFLGSYNIVMASSFWNGTRAAKKVGQKLDKLVVRASFVKAYGIETDRVDFSVENPDNWAHIKGSVQDYSILFGYPLDNHDLNGLLKEFNLDGIILTNSRNEAKIKNVVTKSLETVVRENFNKGGVEAILEYHALENFEFDPDISNFMFLKDFSSFRQSIKDAYSQRVTISSRIMAKALNNSEYANKIKAPIMRRCEVFNSSWSKYLDNWVVNKAAYSLLHEESKKEIEEFIKFKKRGY